MDNFISNSFIGCAGFFIRYAEYSALLSQKKAAYPAYRKARDEMQELKKAQKNVELFFVEEKDPKEKSQTR